MNSKRKYNLIFLLITIPVGITLFYSALFNYRGAYERQINASADSYINILTRSSNELLQSGGQKKVNLFLRAFCQENPNIEYVYILDNNGLILHHSLEGDFQHQNLKSEVENIVAALFCRHISLAMEGGREIAIGLKTTAYNIGYYSFAAFLFFLFSIVLSLGTYLIGYFTNKNIYMEMAQQMGAENLEEVGILGWTAQFNRQGELVSDRKSDKLGNPRFTDRTTTPDEKTEEGKKSLKFLHSMSKSLSSVQNIHQLLEKFTDILLKSMINTNCRIALFDKKQTHLIIEIDKSLTDNKKYSQTGKKFPSQIVTKNKDVIGKEIISVLRVGDLSDRLSDLEKEFFFRDGLQSVLFICLYARGRCLGYVLLGEKRHWERSPFNREKIEFCMTLVNQAIVAMECATLYKQNHDIYLNAVSSLTKTLDARDSYTHEHSRGVTEYAQMLAKSIGLCEKDLETIANAGLLHDIGKIAIPDYILHKADKLTDMEFQLIKEHPIRGAKILEPVKEFENIIPVVAHHHENFDGSGYCTGLQGKDIPLGARIMAIADSFHAMISDRPYRQGLSFDNAVKELIRCRGSQFDPELVDIFIANIVPSESAQQVPDSVISPTYS